MGAAGAGWVKWQRDRGGDTHTHTALLSLRPIWPRALWSCKSPSAPRGGLVPCSIPGRAPGGGSELCPWPHCVPRTCCHRSAAPVQSVRGPWLASEGPEQPLGGCVAEVGMTPGSGEGRRGGEDEGATSKIMDGCAQDTGCSLRLGLVSPPLAVPCPSITHFLPRFGYLIPAWAPGVQDPSPLLPALAAPRELVQIRKRGRACVCV